MGEEGQQAKRNIATVVRRRTLAEWQTLTPTTPAARIVNTPFRSR